MADLKSEGTLPLLREALIIAVMGVIRISIFCLRIEVGIGSKSHVFVPDDDTMFLTKHTGFYFVAYIRYSTLFG